MSCNTVLGLISPHKTKKPDKSPMRMLCNRSLADFEGQGVVFGSHTGKSKLEGGAPLPGTGQA
jgi:hypothetical protein